MKLYEIDETIRQLEAEMDHEDFDFSEEGLEAFNQKLAHLEIDRAKKLCGIASLVREKLANVAILKGEIDRLKRKKEIEQNKVDSLKDWLTCIMRDKEKIGDGIISIRRSSSERVEVDESMLDIRYFRVTEKREPDKTTIKENLKAGEKVAGAWLETNHSVVIK